jgi:RHS repeat-associated protein
VLRFAGREHDAETGLYFNRARYYDPVVGRFISEDPLGLEAGNNVYAYAGSDPVNKRDPSGMWEECYYDTQDAWVASGPVTTISTGATTGSWTSSYQPGTRFVCKSTGRHAWDYPREGSQNRPRGLARGGVALPREAACSSGLVIATGGGAAGLTELETIRGGGAGMSWRGANGVWYSTSWGGNQWTGGRNGVVATGTAARMAGRAFGGASMAISLYQTVGSARVGDYTAASLNALDAVMSGVGVFGGPVGLGVSVAWFAYRYFSSCGG